MDRRDHTFLTEVAQFTHKNHIASAYIYRTRLNSREELEDVAVFAENQFRHYASSEVALEEVRQYNEAKAIERIICAKIFAEFVSACEDLGALGDAIKHRQKAGVFLRYLSSSVGQAASFFDDVVLPHDVLNDPSVTIGTLLGLPDVAVLARRFSSADYDEIQQSFRNQAINLYVAATMYRDKKGTQVRTVGGSDVLPAEKEDEIHILLDVIPAGDASTQKGGIYSRALNKVKHRFMVTDQLREYTQAGMSIEYAVLKPGMMDTFVDSTVAVAGTMAELAALLLHLDMAGVAL
jgi:hypothetical protein